MADSPIHILKKLTNSNHQLAKRLITHKRELEIIAQQIAIIMPDFLNQHYQVANFRDNILILQTESSVWANRLRYQLPVILTYLNKHGWPQLTNIRIYVNTPQLITNATAPRPIISKKTIELLFNLAQTEPNRELRAAWRRLATHRCVKDNQ